MEPDFPTITALQADLACRNLYHGKLDGEFGPLTLAAIDLLHGANAPAWMDPARAEFGVSEIYGPRHNPRILEYHAATTLRATSDEIPWCSSFVNWGMQRSGIPRTASAAARSWLDWGKSLAAPRYGAVCVFTRGNPPAGHVAFFIATIGGIPHVLGGNQGNRVKVAGFAQNSLIASRWPA